MRQLILRSQIPVSRVFRRIQTPDPERSEPAPKTRNSQPAGKSAPRRNVKPPPESLSAAERRLILKWASSHSDQEIRRYGANEAFIDSTIKKCLDYHRSRGKSAWKADYVASCRNWIRRECEWGMAPAPKRAAEKIINLEESAREIENGRVQRCVFEREPGKNRCKAHPHEGGRVNPRLAPGGASLPVAARSPSPPRVTGEQRDLFACHPMARASDPLGSHEAADTMQASGVARGQRELAVQAVFKWPGMSSRELSALVSQGNDGGLAYHSLARRLPEAEREGRIHARQVGKRLRWWPGPDPSGNSRRGRSCRG